MDQKELDDIKLCDFVTIDSKSYLVTGIDNDSVFVKDLSSRSFCSGCSYGLLANKLAGHIYVTEIKKSQIQKIQKLKIKDFVNGKEILGIDRNCGYVYVKGEGTLVTKDILNNNLYTSLEFSPDLLPSTELTAVYLLSPEHIITHQADKNKDKDKIKVKVGDWIENTSLAQNYHNLIKVAAIKDGFIYGESAWGEISSIDSTLIAIGLVSGKKYTKIPLDKNVKVKKQPFKVGDKISFIRSNAEREAVIAVMDQGIIYYEDPTGFKISSVEFDPSKLYSYVLDTRLFLKKIGTTVKKPSNKPKFSKGDWIKRRELPHHYKIQHVSPTKGLLIEVPVGTYGKAFPKNISKNLDPYKQYEWVSKDAIVKASEPLLENKFQVGDVVHFGGNKVKIVFIDAIGLNYLEDPDGISCKDIYRSYSSSQGKLDNTKRYLVFNLINNTFVPFIKLSNSDTVMVGDEVSINGENVVIEAITKHPKYPLGIPEVVYKHINGSLPQDDDVILKHIPELSAQTKYLRTTSNAVFPKKASFKIGDWIDLSKWLVDSKFNKHQKIVQIIDIHKDGRLLYEDPLGVDSFCLDRSYKNIEKTKNYYNVSIDALSKVSIVKSPFTVGDWVEITDIDTVNKWQIKSAKIKAVNNNGIVLNTPDSLVVPHYYLKKSTEPDPPIVNNWINIIENGINKKYLVSYIGSYVFVYDDSAIDTSVSYDSMSYIPIKKIPLCEFLIAEKQESGYVVGDTVKYKNKISTIKNIHWEGNAQIFDLGEYSPIYFPNLFEKVQQPISPPKEPKYKIGDFVSFFKDGKVSETTPIIGYADGKYLVPLTGGKSISEFSSFDISEFKYKSFGDFDKLKFEVFDEKEIFSVYPSSEFDLEEYINIDGVIVKIKAILTYGCLYVEDETNKLDLSNFLFQTDELEKLVHVDYRSIYDKHIFRNQGWKLCPPNPSWKITADNFPFKVGNTFTYGDFTAYTRTILKIENGMITYSIRYNDLASETIKYSFNQFFKNKPRLLTSFGDFDKLKFEVIDNKVENTVEVKEVKNTISSFKQEASTSLYRIGARKLSKTTKEFILHALESQNSSIKTLKALEGLLDSQYGTAIISGIVSLALSRNKDLANDLRFVKLTEELKIDSMALAINGVANSILLARNNSSSKCRVVSNPQVADIQLEEEFQDNLPLVAQL